MYLPEQVAGWQTLVEKLHGEGCTVVCQLWHAGRMSHSSFLDGQAPKAPSAIPVQKQHLDDPENSIEPNGIQGADDNVYDHETPTELSTAEVEAIVQEYVKAAKLAQEAGFDGIEIHAATGYLIDTFLQSCSNERVDKYGVDRFTFLREILQGIAQTSYPLSRVGVKLSPNNGFNGMGSSDNFEHYLGVAQDLDEMGIAYLHVMDGITPDVEKWWGKMTSSGFHGKCKPLALSELKHVTGDMFLIGNSNYTAETAAQRVSEGNAGAISFGRPFFANPDLPIRFKNGTPLAAPPAKEAWFAPSDRYRDDPRWGYLDVETECIEGSNNGN
jgi:2,4-dienoyl-CoA reductase-like NADH-dependent reductase (Old Yellow Enzyme family)